MFMWSLVSGPASLSSPVVGGTALHNAYEPSSKNPKTQRDACHCRCFKGGLSPRLI